MSEAAVATQEYVPPKPVERLTETERTEWLKTGDLPPAEAPKRDSSLKKEDSTSSQPVKKADSGPAKQDKTAEEKEADKELNFKALREKAERLEKELEEWKKKGEKSDVKTAETSTAAPVTKPEPPAKPKRADFASDELYEKAWEEDYLPKKHAFDDANAAFEKQQKEITERQQGLLSTWKGITDKGKEIYGEADWKKVTDSYTDFSIYAGDPIEVQLRGMEADVSARFMQYMSLKPADITRILKLPLREQFKELDALETALREEIGGKKSAKVEEEAPPKKEKELTQAGKPPKEAGGTASAGGGDDADAALKRGDTDEYRRIMNARDLAKRKAKFGRK